MVKAETSKKCGGFLRKAVDDGLFSCSCCCYFQREKREGAHRRVQKNERDKVPIFNIWMCLVSLSREKGCELISNFNFILILIILI
ncbi:unnamed protein product [Phytomonas sp. EM1]|nr:unnamed protein product [Phytomonas sp. EM1]|eukprot:CCW60419.1 unnamed protein product [Phytomonas sp. isolate EM1]